MLVGKLLDFLVDQMNRGMECFLFENGKGRRQRFLRVNLLVVAESLVAIFFVMPV